VNDKVKHRIVGIVVIVAFLVIIVPALVKNIGGHKETMENLKNNETQSQPVSSIPTLQTQETVQPFETAPVAQVSLDQAQNQTQIQTQAQTQTNTTVNAVTQTPVSDIPISQPEQESMPQTISEPETTNTTTAATIPEPEPAPVVKVVKVKPKPIKKPVKIKVIKAKAKAKAKNIIVKKPVKKPVQENTKNTENTVFIIEKMRTPHAPQQVTVIHNPSGNITYCLQMGAYANPANANSLVERLKAHGLYSAHTTAIQLPNGLTVHKVSLCKQLTPAQAIALRNELMQSFRTPVIVVRQ